MNDLLSLQVIDVVLLKKINAKNGIYIKNAINAQGTLLKIHEE